MSKAVFDPKKTKIKDAKANSLITLGKNLKEWDLLQTAVEQKVDEQEDFVAWWDGAVTPNRAHKRTDSTVRTLSVAKAEYLTDISMKQTSRWRTRLKNRP